MEELVKKLYENPNEFNYEAVKEINEYKQYILINSHSKNKNTDKLIKCVENSEKTEKLISVFLKNFNKLEIHLITLNNP